MDNSLAAILVIPIILKQMVTSLSPMARSNPGRKDPALHQTPRSNLDRSHLGPRPMVMTHQVTLQKASLTVIK